MQTTLLRTIVLTTLALLFVPATPYADDVLDELTNFRAYSDRIASSGQPTEIQLKLLQSRGYERIVYLAYSNSDGSLENEDQLVEQLGMQFIQVPVDWDQPLKSDFYAFASMLNQAPETRTLVHCQVNFRASTFSFLYRVLHLGVPIDEAKADLESVWIPNDTWQTLIFEILEENDISPDCDACLWSTSQENS
jgi:protein tyrosine phosphatase (PTP) superfamily phosphohydrolase (DUF442 family)